ncbi:MAG: hypothetical protein R3300_12355 [Candidatus Promineifilaceae bacterium]|nr:hypothetical protein [Candidatus Promineifilaceae bacterium]
MLIAARFLFYLNAVIWVALGLATLGRETEQLSAAVIILAMLMASNGAIMAWLGWRLPYPRRRSYYAALAWLFLNVLLTVTDEFGLLDALTLILDLVLVGLLIGGRSRVLNQR